MPSLNFKYCECGCHGFEASRNGQHFWIYNDLRGGFHLHLGHGFIGQKIGSYYSYAKAIKAAEKLVSSGVPKSRTKPKGLRAELVAARARIAELEGRLASVTAERDRLLQGKSNRVWGYDG